MPSISQKELREMQLAGAKVSVGPKPVQRVSVEGLADQLRSLTPDNSEVLEAIRTLVETLSNSTVVECAPQIECTPRVESVNNNRVLVDTTPILEAVERLTQKSNYHFTINRDGRGRIESMDARVL